MDDEASALLDWRSFYVDLEGIGHATCGFGRLVAKRLLRTVIDIFDPMWEEKTKLSGEKPSRPGVQR